MSAAYGREQNGSPRASPVKNLMFIRPMHLTFRGSRLAFRT
jgi:hypothetical protein